MKRMIPSLTIRPARGDEASALAILGQATFLSSYAHMIPQADMVAHCRAQHSPEIYARWLTDEAVSIWVASVPQTENLVGYAVVLPPEFPALEVKPGDWELRRIYIADRWARTGLGQRLMTGAVSEVMERGGCRLLLAVYHDNQPALAFYRKAGFREAGTRSFLVGTQQYHDLILAKDVQPLT